MLGLVLVKSHMYLSPSCTAAEHHGKTPPTGWWKRFHGVQAPCTLIGQLYCIFALRTWGSMDTPPPERVPASRALRVTVMLIRWWENTLLFWKCSKNKHNHEHTNTLLFCPRRWTCWCGWRRRQTAPARKVTTATPIATVAMTTSSIPPWSPRCDALLCLLVSSRQVSANVFLPQAAEARCRFLICLPLRVLETRSEKKTFSWNKGKRTRTALLIILRERTHGSQKQYLIPSLSSSCCDIKMIDWWKIKFTKVLSLAKGSNFSYSEPVSTCLQRHTLSETT